MKRVTRLALASALLMTIVPGVVHAHFKLMEPTSWLVESDRGDPQKAGPCGGTNTDWGVPTYAVTKATGGQKLHVKLQETIFHPGHYRIALAVNSPNELPPDPKVMTMDTEKGPRSVSAEIENPAKMPVLVDGLWAHTVKQDTPWETDVTLPNINCPKCTLQIAEFMAEHAVNNPGNFTYHHCANVQITADASKPIDKEWPLPR
jgi:hypothetical protein